MSEKKIKILVITDGQSGCAYFRSIRPHQYIAQHYGDKFEITIKTKINLADISTEIEPYDIIHIHQQFDKDMSGMKLFKFLDKKVVVDIDDYWHLGNDHPMNALSRTEKWYIPILEYLKQADMVSTTTEVFRKKILSINKNCNVYPNAIDTTDPQFQPTDKKSDRLRIGMICGSSHLADFKLMDGFVQQLSQDTLNKIQFVLCGFDTRGTKTTYKADGTKEVLPIEPQESVWCDYEKIVTNNYKIISPHHKQFLDLFIPQSEYPNKSEGYRRIWTKDIWHYATHYNEIDVLLVPLKTNEFNSYKSDLKVAEAGFFHKAIVASDFGPYQICLNSILEKGGKLNDTGNALLVDPTKNHKLWGKYITMLANNPDLVKKLQDNLYETVKDRYSIETVCKQRVKDYLTLMGETVTEEEIYKP